MQDWDFRFIGFDGNMHQADMWSEIVKLSGYGRIEFTLIDEDGDDIRACIPIYEFFINPTFTPQIECKSNTNEVLCHNTNLPVCRCVNDVRFNCQCVCPPNPPTTICPSDHEWVNLGGTRCWECVSSGTCVAINGTCCCDNVLTPLVDGECPCDEPDGCLCPDGSPCSSHPDNNCNKNWCICDDDCNRTCPPGQVMKRTGNCGQTLPCNECNCQCECVDGEINMKKEIEKIKTIPPLSIFNQFAVMGDKKENNSCIKECIEGFQEGFKLKN